MHYLCPLAHFQKSADGVEGSCAADVQMGLVVGLQDPDEVITLFLKKEMRQGALKKKTSANVEFHTMRHTAGKEI